jgi:hypothetical protein
MVTQGVISGVPDLILDEVFDPNAAPIYTTFTAKDWV